MLVAIEMGKFLGEQTALSSDGECIGGYSVANYPEDVIISTPTAWNPETF